MRNSVRTVAASRSAPLGRSGRSRAGRVVARDSPRRSAPLAFVERLAILADVPLLRGAGIQVLVELADSIEEVTFEPGSAIFERGDRRGQILLVLEGEAEGNRLDPGAHACVFGPGSVVGGVASLGEPILAWQARAITRVRALSMSLEDWFDLMEEHFDLVRSALSAIALPREAILDDLSASTGELRVG